MQQVSKATRTLLRIARVRRVRAEVTLKSIKDELDLARSEYDRLCHAINCFEDTAGRPEDLRMSYISGTPQELSRRISACEARISSLSHEVEGARRALLEAHFSENALAAHLP